MKAWLKGGLIGIGICLLLCILLFLAIYNQQLNCTNTNCFDAVLIGYSLIYSSILFALIIFFIIGAIIGWIVGKIKLRGKK